MKKIKKTDLDELIQLTIKFAECGDVDILDARNNRAENLATQYGASSSFSTFSGLVNCVVGIFPLDPERRYESVYKVLEVLEIEVV